MKILYESFSECGPRRRNEDYICLRELPRQGRYVFVLCDGMGGHSLGEVASRLVAEHICGFWEKNPKRADSVNKVMDACDETMTAFNSRSRTEMGTTMAMVAIENGRALLAHCGDSRIYVVRDRRIVYHSVDHVALSSEGWPIITCAFFSGSTKYRPDIKELDLQDGDIILLCSDGVFGAGKWSSVQDALTGAIPAADLLPQLRAIASTNAHDNYSAILISVQSQES